MTSKDVGVIWHPGIPVPCHVGPTFIHEADASGAAPTPLRCISTVKMESWDNFGQKVDICSRIREILVNYPEGVSVVKELLQVQPQLALKICAHMCADTAFQASCFLAMLQGHTRPSGPVSRLVNVPVSSISVSCTDCTVALPILMQ